MSEISSRVELTATTAGHQRDANACGCYTPLSTARHGQPMIPTATAAAAAAAAAAATDADSYPRPSSSAIAANVLLMLC